MKVSFSEIKQAFKEFHPRDLMEYGITLPFKFTAGVLQGIGVGCFTKAAGVNFQVIIGERDIADLTNDTAILIGVGTVATLGAFLLYEVGEHMMGYRSSVVVKNTFLLSSPKRGGKRR